MASALAHLLALRRAAENRAADLLDRARSARAAEEAEQTRLLGGWRQAVGALDGEREWLAPAGATAAQAMTHVRYRARLEAEVACAAERADAHRRRVLAVALQAEGAAKTALEQAHAAVEAVASLLAREEAEAERLAARRAEDSACDLANAALVRGRTR